MSHQLLKQSLSSSDLAHIQCVQIADESPQLKLYHWNKFGSKILFQTFFVSVILENLITGTNEANLHVLIALLLVCRANNGLQFSLMDSLC